MVGRNTLPPSSPPLDGGNARRAGSTQRCGLQNQVNAALILFGGSRPEKYMPQLQHNMWVVASRTAVLSVITGGGNASESWPMLIHSIKHLIVTAERKFWRCVENGEQPQLFGVEPPKPRLEPVRIVDMSSSNAWAEFAARSLKSHLPTTAIRRSKFCSGVAIPALLEIRPKVNV
jgi:hypothetical protein